MATARKNRPAALGFPSQLKPFEVARVEVEESGKTIRRLDVTCPRCGRTAEVRESWLKSSDLGTRPCTYCSKTSVVPKV